MASASGSTKVCFNSTCKQALEAPKQGWLCRTGDFADLCDRCASAFKEEKFCDTYHLDASGWRSCESCGKQIHCGCIVSFHMFILLDAGGIECLNCAKTEYILTPNPTWPSASHSPPGPTERIRDISSKNWMSITADVSSERLVNDSWRETIGDRVKATGVQYDGKHNLFGDIFYQSLFNSNEVATPLSCLPPTFVAPDQKSEKGKESGIGVQQLCSPPSIGKKCSDNNGTRGRHKLLPRYWPRITNQELQQISGGSHAKITPLFEKVLSASDAGRIGRLVLPKKCAEAYLPPISQPEGYPLVVQDLKGKDWVLQFRFWPNNNSRMYVLEGVTPCIQSMQLQAGDTVTFSRLEPEGKLLMGFRKAPITSPSYQVKETTTPKVSFTHEESSKGGRLSAVDKISICNNKRKKAANMCSKNDEKMHKLNISLEQLQGLFQPRGTDTPTVMLIEGVEFEDYHEAPIVASSTTFSTNNGSICSTKVEQTPEHTQDFLPTVNHVSSNINNSENPESVKTIEEVDKTICSPTPGGTKHKLTCTCNVCLAGKCCMPPQIIHHDQKYFENFSFVETLWAIGNTNQIHKTGPSESFENTPPSFKSQNIDLNIQPDRDEESSPAIS